MKKAGGNLLSVFFLACFGWLGVAAHSAVGAENGSGIRDIHSAARLVEMGGFIMFVDQDKGILVVDEKTIVVGAFRVNDEARFTRMANGSGATVDLEYFNAGQWVAVRGYAVSKTEIRAVSVHAAAGYLDKEVHKIKQLE